MDDIIHVLEGIIEDRRAHPRPDSYTCQLLEAGPSRILKKVGEEAVEVVLAGATEDDGRLVSEIADFFFHLTVALASRDLTWAEVASELGRRNS